MKNYQYNADVYNQSALNKKNWQETVDYVAADLHKRAIELGGRNGALPLRVLDLGAGETGLSTFPYLVAGCKVYAVDAAENALVMLKDRSKGLGGDLITCNADIEQFVSSAIRNNETYDIVVARSFLHHIPDYVGTLREMSRLLSPQGVFLSYEDPMRYDTVPRFSHYFAWTAYFSKRIFQGGYLSGLKSRLRRIKGEYREDLPEDMVEYHVVRGGVDQDAIRKMFEEIGLKCEVVRYFSTVNSAFRGLGRSLGVQNNFAVLAYRP